MEENSIGGQRGAYFVEAIEHLHGRRPVNTGVGDRDTVLESRRTIWWDVLAAAVDVRLDHHTGDSIVAGTKLFADVVDDLGLVVVVLLRVAVCMAQVSRSREKIERRRRE